MPDGRRFEKFYDTTADRSPHPRKAAMCGSEPIALSVISVATASRLSPSRIVPRLARHCAAALGADWCATLCRLALAAVLQDIPSWTPRYKPRSRPK